MKIDFVKAHLLAVPAQASENAAQVPWMRRRLNQVIVELRTADGLVGWGDAFSYGVSAATASVVEHTLAPMLLGQDARNIRGLVQTLFQQTHIFGRYGVTTFAISGVELALWDLCGKRAGRPLWELLGGASRMRIPAYASLIRYPEGHEQIALDARQAMREGYTCLKLHQTTAASVALAREAIGADVPLTVDINCEWTPLQAVGRAREMNQHNLLWLEEPVWPPEDYQGLARVQREGGVPIASGENACTAFQFRELARQGGATYLQPSVIKVGGIGEWLKVAHLAELSGLELAPHSPYFGPGFAATLHLIAHSGRPQWIEQIYFSLEASLFTQPLAFEHGDYLLPQGPGLGVEVSREVLKEYAAPPE